MRSTQAPSQRTSVGQARAQLPPKMLASRIVLAAPNVVVVQDLADKARNVDVRRAGAGARGVETEQAARGFDPSRGDTERRRDVGELCGQLLGGLPITGPEHAQLLIMGSGGERTALVRPSYCEAAASGTRSPREPARSRGSQRPHPCWPTNL